MNVRARLPALGGAAAVLAVYALALLFERYGVRSAVHGSDVALYRADAHAVAAGQLPYRDLYFEYPPGALAPILAPQPAGDYAAAFKALMAVLGAGLLALAVPVLRAVGQRPLVRLLAIAVAPLAVGSVFVNRFDVWPALLLLAGLVLLLRGRTTTAFVALALGTATKIFPVVALPVAAVWVWRTGGRDALRRGLVAFGAALLAVLVPFAALGPGGLRFSFTIQLTRHLQTESLAGAILLAAGKLGIYSPTIATAAPGSLDLFGTLPNLLALLGLLVALGAIVWLTWTAARGELDEAGVVAAVAAAVTAYVAFGKVLSPQYLIWLIPLVPLVRGAAGALATALLTAALVLTQLEFDRGYHELHTLGPVVWVLLARDLVLVALAAVLLVVVRRQALGGSQTSKPPLLTSR